MATVIQRGELTSQAEAVATALETLRSLLEDHGAACPCRECHDLEMALQALPSLGLLCTLVEAGSRQEWDCQGNHAGPCTDIANACLGD